MIVRARANQFAQLLPVRFDEIDVVSQGGPERRAGRIERQFHAPAYEGLRDLAVQVVGNAWRQAAADADEVLAQPRPLGSLAIRLLEGAVRKGQSGIADPLPHPGP